LKIGRALPYFLAIAVVVVGTLNGPIAAQAAPQQGCLVAGSQSAPKTKSERAATVNSAIVAMLKRGMNDDQIASELRTGYGVDVKGEPAAQPAISYSTGNDIAVYAPNIAYDTCGHTWYVYAHYQWNSIGPIQNDMSGLCNDPCSIGGLDGFGVTLSRSVVTSGALMQTWGLTSWYPIWSGRTWLNDLDQYGASFEGQDQYCWPYTNGCTSNDYNMYHGELFYYISTIGCGGIQAFAKYLHTWNTTTINGFGVGPWSFSVSWGGGTSHWERASAPSVNVVPC
jgi:hypothetical protein